MVDVVEMTTVEKTPSRFIFDAVMTVGTKSNDTLRFSTQRYDRTPVIALVHFIMVHMGEK